jgi:hypothetical protein
VILLGTFQKNIANKATWWFTKASAGRGFAGNPSQAGQHVGNPNTSQFMPSWTIEPIPQPRGFLEQLVLITRLVISVGLLSSRPGKELEVLSVTVPNTGPGSERKARCNLSANRLQY